MGQLLSCLIEMNTLTHKMMIYFSVLFLSVNCVNSEVQMEQNLLEEHVGLFPALKSVTESEKTDEDVFKYLLDVELQAPAPYMSGFPQTLHYFAAAGETTIF